jgi:hypothetical protein
LKLFAAIAFFGVVSASQATTLDLSCTLNGNQLVGTSGSQTEVCDTSALVGQTINSITVNYQFTLQVAPFQPGSANFSFDGPGGADYSGTVVGSGTSPVGSINVSAAEFGLWNAGSSISVVDSYTGTSFVQSGSFGKQITVDFSAPVTGQTPEPSTFIMLGSALTALGAMARRRK